MCWLAAEQQKRRKDEDKKRARKKRAARDALEKCRWAQEREGLPLQASSSTEDDDDNDDDDEGMEVRLGFNPEVRTWSEPSLACPSVGPDVPVLGLEAFVPLPETQASAKPGPVPAVEEEATAAERPADPLPVPTSGTKGPRSQGPRRIDLPWSRKVVMKYQNLVFSLSVLHDFLLLYAST
jgi:hypothetical protein